MAEIRNDHPVRLTVAEMRALVRASGAALTGRPVEWTDRTREALERASEIVGHAAGYYSK